MKLSPTALKDYWTNEGRKYYKPHFRVDFIASLISTRLNLANGRVLDLGGGPGNLKTSLENIGLGVYVVDIASTLSQDVTLHDLTLELPLAKIPSVWLPFNVFVISGLLEYLPNWVNVFSVVRQCLQPDGWGIISYINFRNHHLWQKKRHHPLWVNHQQPDQVQRALVTFGLRTEGIYGISPRPARFNRSPQSYLAWQLHRIPSKFSPIHLFVRQFVWLVRLD